MGARQRPLGTWGLMCPAQDRPAEHSQGGRPTGPPGPSGPGGCCVGGQFSFPRRQGGRWLSSSRDVGETCSECETCLISPAPGRHRASLSESTADTSGSGNQTSHRHPVSIVGQKAGKAACRPSRHSRLAQRGRLRAAAPGQCVCAWWGAPRARDDLRGHSTTLGAQSLRLVLSPRPLPCPAAGVSGERPHGDSGGSAGRQPHPLTRRAPTGAPLPTKGLIQV